MILDWSDSRHWGGKPRPCRLCGHLTRLVDDAARPAHKVCVEAELAGLTFIHRARDGAA